VAVTKYVYDGDTVLQETDGSGTTLTEYTSTGQGYGDLLSAYDGSAAKYYEPDALGSTDALADQSQTVVDRWRYRAFGTATQTAGTDATPFTWVGHQGYYADSETGLYQLGNGTRYYDPVTAQFLSKDPIGFGGGDPNLYRYAVNQPTRRTDPSGTIQVIELPEYRKRGKCGDVKTTEQSQLAWIFKLDVPAKKDGYIIQQVTAYITVARCPCNPWDAKKSTVPKSVTFWEVIGHVSAGNEYIDDYYAKGDSLSPTHPGPKWAPTIPSDFGTFPPIEGYCGIYYALGLVRFFYSIDTLLPFSIADWSNENTYKVPGYPMQIGRGDEPTSGSRPPWWDNGFVASEGTARSYFSVAFRCCGLVRCPDAIVVDPSARFPFANPPTLLGPPSCLIEEEEEPPKKKENNACIC
jgi:RHS repeat-associated protein